MADDTIPISLIRTKLHQPPIHENHIHRQRLLDRLHQRLQRPLTLVAAPAGYGKTTLVSCWLDASRIPNAWISLDKNDNDLRFFLRYLLAAVQTMFPDAGREIQAMVNALTLPPVSVLAGSLINAFDRIEKPFILVLDDFHIIKDESVLDLLTQLLHHPPQAMHLVLIGRRDPALPITTLRAKGLLTEIRTQDLRFNEMETAMFLTQELGTQIDSSTAAVLEEKTEGWVTGLRLAAISMRHRGSLDPKLLDPQLEAQYVMEYLFTEVFSQKPPEISQYLLRSAILGRFSGPLCEALCVQDPERLIPEISGWEFIAWLKMENMFLIPLDAENRWFRYHHLFQKLLLNQLKRHLGPEDIKVLHARASAWFAENGLIEEALKHALAGENSAAAARLVAQHGFNLVSEEQWPMLERWLNLLPNDIVYQDPELLILTAWTHLVFFRHEESMSCLERADALFSAQPSPAKATKHLPGHFDAMRAFWYYLSASGERAIIHAERAIENIHRKHRWPRNFVFGLGVIAYQMVGDSEKAQSILEEMIRDESLRGGSSEGFLLTSPCFFCWINADLTAMLQAASRSQKIDADLQNPWGLGHSLYFLGIAYYHRNELHTAEEKLLPLVKSPYLYHSLDFAHGAFALALIYQTWGRADETREVAESVISYALDTNNTAVLQIARALQAELALRQKRLAETSHWVGQFVAKPFTAMYRFYVPQLTLVKVLLAQDTTDSHEQAGDLLTQLYDFVVSTHNTRFQIDVLALQALFHHSQGDAPAALKALTEALTLAEPGGFIRLFVDLGPPMADLLKHLASQNVAVGYIGKILAAFREDAQRAIPDATDHESPSSDLQVTLSPHLPLSSSLTSQPLVEPLTNREFEILELLTQRMSTKEIAAKLFISPTTVKKHLNNIYGKLNVSNRREAGEKAVTLGVLTRR